MPDSIVDNLSGLKKSTVSRNSRRSADWLKNKINGGKVDKSLIKSKPLLGRMYHFAYNPKLKSVLPYYDRNPLVIVMDIAGGGFQGLNLHYLAPKVRLLLLNKLMVFATNKKMNETTRLRVTYSLLKGVAKYKEFKPCVKNYLFSHLSTKFALIPASDWENAVFMPTARFVGASNNKVYQNSRRIYT